MVIEHFANVLFMFIVNDLTIFFQSFIKYFENILCLRRGYMSIFLLTVFIFSHFLAKRDANNSINANELE